MARILGYIASSLDGFIADPNQPLEWLSRAGEADLGEHDYHRFIKRIRTIVMGRTTYDWLISEGSPWPYGGLRVIVVTSRPIAHAPGAIETRSDIDVLVADAESGRWRRLDGGRRQAADGLPGARCARRNRNLRRLRDHRRRSSAVSRDRTQGLPRLISAKSFGPDMARLHYRFD